MKRKKILILLIVCLVFVFIFLYIRENQKNEKWYSVEEYNELFHNSAK